MRAPFRIKPTKLLRYSMLLVVAFILMVVIFHSKLQDWDPLEDVNQPIHVDIKAPEHATIQQQPRKSNEDCDIFIEVLQLVRQLRTQLFCIVIRFHSVHCSKLYGVFYILTFSTLGWVFSQSERHNISGWRWSSLEMDSEEDSIHLVWMVANISGLTLNFLAEAHKETGVLCIETTLSNHVNYIYVLLF